MRHLTVVPKAPKVNPAMARHALEALSMAPRYVTGSEENVEENIAFLLHVLPEERALKIAAYLRDPSASRTPLLVLACALRRAIPSYVYTHTVPVAFAH